MYPQATRERHHSEWRKPKAVADEYGFQNAAAAFIPCSTAFPQRGVFEVKWTFITGMSTARHRNEYSPSHN
ncbi:hypothetical protein [Flavihumibacter profundi]|uniref:hypothetical protein n=1 Tax=Flavihumibacter profundi TaxID=2716883 RepID=UPI001CC4709A|nr:hypothetical protein [Flavihumibacter profundi]MBZ5858544.1 hypothetical protein [Flavihumibacter profundi]